LLPGEEPGDRSGGYPPVGGPAGRQREIARLIHRAEAAVGEVAVVPAGVGQGVADQLRAAEAVAAAVRQDGEDRQRVVIRDRRVPERQVEATRRGGRLHGKGGEAPQEARLLEPRLAGGGVELVFDVVQVEHRPLWV